MRKILICSVLALLNLGELFSFSISAQDADRVAERIWKNECHGRIEGLTSWNRGESFASLGIGHFIWYPVGKRERFEETFPSLLKFLQKEGVILPDWLKSSRGCPWNTREEFYQDLQSPKMKSLRQCLLETKHLQALFMAKRLEEALPQILGNLPPADKEKAAHNFYRLTQEAEGLYALIDYVNFKGTGTSSSEAYQGQGWGLRQVLLKMTPSSTPAVASFVQAAKEILSQRVQNSPPERHENQWLKGWFNRLDTYLNFP